MPSGEIGGEEEAGDDGDSRESPPGPVNRLSSHGSDDEKEGKREREPPEARGHRTDARQPDEPGPERQRAAADQQCGEGEWMMARPVHGSALREIDPRPEA